MTAPRDALRDGATLMFAADALKAWDRLAVLTQDAEDADALLTVSRRLFAAMAAEIGEISDALLEQGRQAVDEKVRR